MSQPSSSTLARNATLQDIAVLLEDQHARKADLVAPGRAFKFVDGALVIEGLEPQLSADGVDDLNGTYRPLSTFDGGLSSRLDIPIGYLGRMRASNLPLYDQNANSWLQHTLHRDTPYLVRLFRDGGGMGGVARAFLSDVYKPIDHLDALVAALDGVRSAGVEVNVESCDLTDSRMSVRVSVPEVKALAPTLLKGYTPGFDVEAPRAGGWTLDAARAAASREGLGFEPGSEPVLFAGFEISNSETGHGRFAITPRLVIQICRNGLTLTAHAVKAQHLGARLDPGLVRWSSATLEANLKLITAQARDSVESFCDARWLQQRVDELEKAAGAEIEDVEQTLKVVSQKLQFPEEIRKSVLSHFIGGHQNTAAGVLNAITSVAQLTEDADMARTMEARAVEGMRLAASLAK